MQQYKEILDNLYSGVYFVNKQGKISFWNKAAEEITGFTSEEVLGKSCSNKILTHIDEKGTLLCTSGCPLRKTLKDGKAREANVYLHHKNGHRVPISVRISATKDEDGNITGAVELFTDNSSVKEMLVRMEELEKLALLDPLTRLGNRRFLDITFANRLEEFKRYNWPTGVLFMDLDFFKKVNDRYGHDAGDKVLKSIANTLLCNSRSFDVFGRWGGEEFVGIIRNIDADTLLHIAERFRLLVENSYIQLNEEEQIRVTISIGATLTKPGDDEEKLIRRADELLYASKQNGRNMVTSDLQGSKVAGLNIVNLQQTPGIA